MKRGPASATPIAADRPAKTIAISRPWPAAALATLCCRLAGHAVPEGAALIALDVALGLLLAATSHDHAVTSHTAAHVVLAPRRPMSPPWRVVGHANRPMTAYSRTAPGAPVSGLAVLLNRNPNDSAHPHTIKDHPTDTTSAPFAVRR